MPAADSQLIEQLMSREDATGLAAHVQATSNLPGPRGNLEVAAAVATAFRAANSTWVIESIEEWSELGQDIAGGNDPGVMLPFTAAQSAGALWNASDGAQRAKLAEILRRAANDPRWRVREGAAMGLQRIGFDDFDELKDIVECWDQDATLLEHRAIVAGMAEPPLLTNNERTRFGLDHATAALDALLATSPPERRSDDAQTLRKALGYAFSVFIAADPAGFLQLERIARIPDKDAGWIARENLRKARIAKKFPDECERIAAILCG